MIIALFLVSPLCFLFGFVTGGYHVRRLAASGGEQRFPSFIVDAVETYREKRPQIEEENDG